MQVGDTVQSSAGSFGVVVGFMSSEVAFVDWRNGSSPMSCDVAGLRQAWMKRSASETNTLCLPSFDADQYKSVAKPISHWRRGLALAEAFGGG
ncbi:MAG: hypothetical protein ACRC1H_19230 [Caldilineaceae bacterium]